MNSFFKKVISQLTDYWKSLDGASKRKIIVAAVLLLTVTGTITWLIAKPEYANLYTGLDSKEAGEILKKLEEMKVDARPEGVGTIKVPKKDEARVRMQLAAEGYPKSGTNTYDSFSNSLGLGATDYDKRKAYQFQLQDRLQSTIKTMDGVEDAVVTITIPEQDSFVLREDKQPATASVLLKLSQSLTAKQVKGVEALVSKSVPGLMPENISIVDTNMNALNSNNNDDTDAVSWQYEMETRVRESLQKQVLSLLRPVFGESNVLASVSFRLNFDKKVTNSVKFEPVYDDEGIAVSINELKEEVSGTTAADSGATGQMQYPIQGGGSGDYTRNERTINYEVNKINEQLEEAQGKMTDLKLSVVINNPSLDSHTINNVQRVVANAIGVDIDKIVVSGMAFDGLKADQERFDNARRDAQNKQMWDRVLRIGRDVALALALLLCLFIIYRFIMRLRLPSSDDFEVYQPGEAAVQASELLGGVPEEEKERLSIKQRIDSLVENKPDIVAQQIRDWLNES